MGEVHKKNMRVGILEQANWATPQAASANFKIQPYMAGSPMPQQGVVIDHFDFAAQTGMHADQTRTRIDAITGLKRICGLEY